MESKGMNLGGSLPVPCIQDLVKEALTTIPPRYIRSDQQQEAVISNLDSEIEFPIIDMQSLLSQETMEAELAKHKLDSASREWGFFQLVNHGVSSSLLEKVKKEIQDFFNLPTEEKKKYWQVPGDVEGFGQILVVSEEQKLDWGDLFFMTTLPEYLRKPHLFPNLPLPLREALENYSMELKNLAMALITRMGKALNMNPHEMEDFFEDGLQSMRMNHYPPCPEPDKVIGLTPHNDAIGLTILLQLNEVEGLQIKKDGKWVPVKPLPDAFIVNVGDILVMISNGAYSSMEHRATVNSERERFSIATFYSTKPEGEIGPARSLISEQNPALFKRVGTQEYFRGMFTIRSDHWKPYLNNFRL